MVAGYIAVLYAGHVVVCMFIVCVQVRGPEEGDHTSRRTQGGLPHLRVRSGARLRARGCASRERVVTACGNCSPCSTDMQHFPQPPAVRSQAAIVSELFILAAQKNIEKGLPGFRSQQWYFFVCAAVFVYGRLLKNNFLMEVAENPGLPGIIGACTHPVSTARASRPWNTHN